MRHAFPLILLYSMTLFASEPQPHLKSLKARTAYKTYQAELNTAEREYDRSAKDALDKYKAALGEALELATASGQLDEALAIRDEMRSLTSPVPRKRRELAGTWRIQFGGGGIRTYEIETAGRISWVDSKTGIRRAKIFTMSGGYWTSLIPSEIQRLTPSQGRLYVEHFKASERKPVGTPLSIGVGVRIRKARKKP